MKKTIIAIFLVFASLTASAQINTDRVMMIGRNALHFEDYVLAIQYFNQVISARPDLAQPFYYRALAKFLLDDFQGAEEDATRALERNPFLFSAVQLRGEARQNLGLFELAAADYMQFLQFFPDNRFALLNMAIVNIQMGYLDVAEMFFEVLLRRYPTNIPGLLIRSQMFLEKNDTTSALADIYRVIELNPNIADPFSLRGIIHLQQENYEYALADLTEAIRLNPFGEGNYINRALAHYNLNNLREAMADYDRVIEMNANNMIARFNRGLLRRQVADNNLAIEDFDRVILFEPNNMLAYLNRALLHQEIGNTHAAIHDLSVVLDRHPEFFSGFYMRSQMRMQLGDLRGSEADLMAGRRAETYARMVATDNPDQLAEQRRTRETREESDQNLERFNQLVVANRESGGNQNTTTERQSRGRVQLRDVDITPEPRFVLTYYVQVFEVPRPVYFAPLIDEANRELGLMWALRISNNSARLNEFQIQTHFRSINSFISRLDETPNDPKLYFGRAMDFLHIQDFEHALNDINRAIELKPDFALAYFLRAIIRTNQMQLDHLVTQQPLFGTNIHIAPDQLLPLQPRTLELPMRPQEHNAILRDYERVLELQPNLFFAHYNMAEIFKMQGDYQAALQAYTRAIDIEPRFAEAYFNRGLILLSLGETTAGLNDLRQAGQLGIVQAYGIIARMQR